MIINARILSTTQTKKGLTTLKIITDELDDHISWCGEKVQIKKPEYKVVKVEEEFHEEPNK